MMDHVSDDDIWHRRFANYDQLASQLRIPRTKIKALMRARGWRRDNNAHRFSHAPCSVCGTIFQIDKLARYRLCNPCLNDDSPLPELTDELISNPQALLRRERTRVRRKRQKMGEHAWNDKYLSPRWHLED